MPIPCRIHFSAEISSSGRHAPLLYLLSIFVVSEILERK